MTITEIWQVASILNGFQIATFGFRMNRELHQLKDGAIRWFPIADWLNIVSMMVIVFGVFVIPIATHEFTYLNSVEYCFGLALILFTFYPLTLIGHYELLSAPSKRSAEQKFITCQEIIFLILALIAIFVFTLVFIRYN